MEAICHFRATDRRDPSGQGSVNAEPLAQVIGDAEFYNQVFVDSTSWISGPVPSSNEHWNELRNKNISIILNFSYYCLPGIAGFEIINIRPDVFSILMPMSEQEIEEERYFNSIVNRYCNINMLCVCGDKSNRNAMIKIMAKKRNIGTSSPPKPEYNNLSFQDRKLVNKYAYPEYV